MFIFSQLSQADEYIQPGMTGLDTTGTNPENALFKTFFSTCLDQNQWQKDRWDASDSVSGADHASIRDDEYRGENFSGAAGNSPQRSESVNDSSRTCDECSSARSAMPEAAAGTTTERTISKKTQHDMSATPAERETSTRKHTGNAQDVSGKEGPKVAKEEDDASEPLTKKEIAREQALLEWLVHLLAVDPGTAKGTAGIKKHLEKSGLSGSEAEAALDWLRGVLGAGQGQTTKGKRGIEERLQKLGLSKVELKDVLDLFKKQGAKGGDTSAFVRGLSKEDIALLERIVRGVVRDSGQRHKHELQTVLEKSTDSASDATLEDVRGMLHRVARIGVDSARRKSDHATHPSAVAKGAENVLKGGASAGASAVAATEVSGESGKNQHKSPETLKDVLNAKVGLADDKGPSGPSIFSGQEKGTQGENAGTKDLFAHAEKMMEAAKASGLRGKKTVSGGQTLGSTSKASDLVGTRDIQSMIKNSDRSVGKRASLSRRIFRQVETGAFKNLSQGKKQLTLRLKPGDLGTVRIVLQVKGKDVEAVLKTSDEDTSRILADQMSHLKNQLEKQGLRVVRLDVQNQATSDNPSGQWAGTSEHNQSQEQHAANMRELRQRSLRGGNEELAHEMHILSQQVKTSPTGVDLFA